MKAWTYLLSLFLLIQIGCNDNVKKPKNLIGQDKMAELMADIYLHQQPAFVNEIPNREWNVAETDMILLKKHGVELADFKESYRFYTLKPDKYKKILEKTRTILEAKLPPEEKERRELERKLPKAEGLK